MTNQDIDDSPPGFWQAESKQSKLDPRVKDLTGRQFGKLRALKPNGRNGAQYRWDCQCVCGNLYNASMTSLTKGKATCCGCEGSEERQRILAKERPNIGRRINGVKCLPSAEFLNACFRYDASSGNLLWKERPAAHFQNVLAWKMWSAHYPHKLVGREQFKAYSKEPHAIVVKVGVCGYNQSFVAHRIIYAMHGIEVPVGMQIDHKDNNPFNNRLDNLRLATGQQNAQNQRKSKRRGLLPKGVFRIKQSGKYQASLRVDGRYVVVGYFDTPAEAAQAYIEAAKETHGEFFCPVTDVRQRTHDEE